MPSTRTRHLRNPVAAAHSLRGPAGSGAHGAQPRPRPSMTVCPDCLELIADCGCPVHPVSGKGRAVRTHRSTPTETTQ